MTLVNTTWAVLAIPALLCAANLASAQASQTPEPVAILELGGAAGQSLTGDGPSGGPNLAVEVTPIENWLELEAGVTPSFGRLSTEWDTDLLFKKPWDLSDKVEFMAGIGPEWIHNQTRGVKTSSEGAQVALDFMFWPSAKHNFGWYLEPAYDHSFAGGREQSIGISGGLLIGLGQKKGRDTRR